MDQGHVALSTKFFVDTCGSISHVHKFLWIVGESGSCKISLEADFKLGGKPYEMKKPSMPWMSQAHHMGHPETQGTKLQETLRVLVL
jgi:hypothetical protein